MIQKKFIEKDEDESLSSLAEELFNACIKESKDKRRHSLKNERKAFKSK